MGELPVARTFEDWWALRTQYGTEDKLLARDAWFAAAAAYNQHAPEVTTSEQAKAAELWLIAFSHMPDSLRTAIERDYAFRHGLRHAPWPNDKDGEITGSEPQRVLPKEE